MSVEVKGTLVDFFVRDPGVTAWRKLVCTEDSSFTINVEVAKRRTNCGIKTSVSDPDFSASGNAIQNAEPTSTECSYAYIKQRMKNKQYQEFKYINSADPTVGVGGLTEGEGVFNFGDGYFTEATLSASAEADGVLKFSWSFEGTGFLDDYESEAVG